MPPMTRVLWALANAVQGLLMVLWSVFWISAALLALLVTRSRRPGLSMARTCWAPGVVALAGARLEVEGSEKVDPAQPTFLVANHQSMMDIPAAFAALPCDLHFVVKEELRTVPFLGWYIGAMGMVFIDRSARIGSLASLGAAADLIRSGRSVISFPEGTRSRSGEIQPFKTGAFVLAIEARVPVTPVAIHGAAGVLPADGFRLRPDTIRVLVGEPIPTADLTTRDRGQLAVEALKRVEKLLEKARDLPAREAEVVSSEQLPPAPA